MSKIAWLEWGPDAFEKARSSGKPILLDITGSWCHWCHVMDETSYSDPVITSMINKSFVPVRVDTDTRPDVNRRYNLGGWPTTAFLDSDGKIITGGTYIPPPQLREVLRSVLDFYSSSKGRMRSKILPPRIVAPKDEPLSEKILRDISTTVAVNFDIDYGGFGFEPKFPHADALDYALLRHRYYGEKEMLTVVTKTLDRMAQGGVYDQIEKG
ncbi:thioredoxin domain-containing protein, partial [Candidatus Bathyarchaeota archaeon]|nr:thioredoxin domain-containing protein [Candidatus Bathyarchaeota archaeon]